MSTASKLFFAWWETMSGMHAKYGFASNIEETSEWPRLQRQQQALLQELSKVTGASEDTVFDTVSEAMELVLGTEDGEIALNREHADEIVKTTAYLVAFREIQDNRSKRLLN